MSLDIIIDGYNLIRQSAGLSDLDSRDVQEGREALLSRLAAYRRSKSHDITVVFDGTAAPAYFQRKDRIYGIMVVFSPAGETADTVIKSLAMQKKERAVVVSSDREIAAFAERQGAAVISSPEFENRLQQALLMEDEAADADAGEMPIPPKTTQKKGPSRRPSKKARKRRKKVKKL